jgi:hypothetical protein
VVGDPVGADDLEATARDGQVAQPCRIALLAHASRALVDAE